MRGSISSLSHHNVRFELRMAGKARHAPARSREAGKMTIACLSCPGSMEPICNGPQSPPHKGKDAERSGCLVAATESGPTHECQDCGHSERLHALFSHFGSSDPPL